MAFNYNRPLLKKYLTKKESLETVVNDIIIKNNINDIVVELVERMVKAETTKIKVSAKQYEQLYSLFEIEANTDGLKKKRGRKPKNKAIEEETNK